MKLKLLLVCFALIAGSLLFIGCRAAPPPAAAQAPVVKVRLLAYINVSSGCQQETVDFLHALPAKFPGLTVEIVDFGDGDAGAARWEQSGLKCMAIELDGHSLVKYPEGGKTKVMAFRAPAGFYWTHEDLTAALQAAATGQLQPATEEDMAAEGTAAPSEEQIKEYRSQREPQVKSK